MKRTVACLALLSAFACSAEEPIRFDASLDVVEQDGYRFRRLARLPQRDWVVEVTRAGNVVHRIFAGKSMDVPPIDGADGIPHLQFAFHTLIPAPHPQLVIRLHTGGNRCCRHHWVLSTHPSLGVLLDTKRFEFDDLAEVVDLDGDGAQELGFWTTTFNFFGVCGACSPAPMAWFRYNASTKRYEPANDRLYPFLKSRYQRALAELPSLKQHLASGDTEEYLRGRVNGVVLDLLYAGQDSEAWTIHEKRWAFGDQPEQRVLIERRLASDPFYQELRARRKRGGR